MRRIGPAIVALVVMAGLGAALLVNGATAGRSVAQSPPDGRAGLAAIATHATRVGALAHGTIGFALNLRMQERKLAAYLTHVDPGAGSTGALTASQFGVRFGPSASQLARLGAELRRYGITVTHLYPQRTAMLVRGTVPQVDRLFSLRFGRYRTSSGRPYFAPEQTPRIPPALAPYVSGLADLSNPPTPADDIPSGGLTPPILTKAYDITPLWTDGIRGQGQTIAVATDFGAINPADLQKFAQLAGISPDVTVKQIDGGSTYNQTNGSDLEVDLDFQTILSVAPAAHLIDYQGSDGSSQQQGSLGHSLADIYNQIEQDGLAKIVSTSYGECESILASQSPGDQQLIDNSLRALEASGVTVFVATGDTGAYACLQAAQQIQPATKLPSEFDGLSVQTPASSPYSVAVGGTRLELRSDGSYLAESAWSDPLQRGGSGGGISDSEARPTWQQGPGVIKPGVNPAGHRQTPDVVGPADPNSGFDICQTQAGASGPTCNGGNGGTSAAAPFWAASMLLVDQYAAAHGAGSLAHCFAAPVLYDLAAKPQPVPPLHEVTLGNNGGYNAGPGWNYATGLGSPDVFNLAQDYTAFLRGLSPHRCPF